MDDSELVVTVNGVVMARAKLPGAALDALLTQGIDPLPSALRNLAERIERGEAESIDSS